MRKIVIVLIINVLLCLFSREVSYSEELIEGFKSYLIKKGDTLSGIAPPDHWDLIMRVNKIDERHLVVGKEILIPEDFDKAKKFLPVPQVSPEIPLGLTTPEHKRIIFFFLDSQYFAAYYEGKLWSWGPISSGRPGFETPKGIFRVQWKSKDYISKRYEVPMPFAVNFSDRGYFFHQQSLPGRPASRGCIRLLGVDAEKLFRWVKRGDIIIIK